MRLSPAATPAPSALPAEAAPGAPVPAEPAFPAEFDALLDAPLVRGEYRGTERDSWWVGVPLLGTKAHSERTVGFSNDFNILRAGGRPFAGYAASSFDDAVRRARDVAFDWSDPALGGKIHASVGVAVLQASDGLYHLALIGSGNPNTSSSALGYRSDRFDEDIHGELKHAKDARATSTWSAPVDKHGKPIGAPAPDDAAKITRRHVKDIDVERFVPATPALKAIVDLHHVFRMDEQDGAGISLS